MSTCAANTFQLSGLPKPSYRALYLALRKTCLFGNRPSSHLRIRCYTFQNRPLRPQGVSDAPINSLLIDRTFIIGIVLPDIFSGFTVITLPLTDIFSGFIVITLPLTDIFSGFTVIY